MSNGRTLFSAYCYDFNTKENKLIKEKTPLSKAPVLDDIPFRLVEIYF